MFDLSWITISSAMSNPAACSYHRIRKGVLSGWPRGFWRAFWGNTLWPLQLLEYMYFIRKKLFAYMCFIGRKFEVYLEGFLTVTWHEWCWQQKCSVRIPWYVYMGSLELKVGRCQHVGSQCTWRLYMLFLYTSETFWNTICGCFYIWRIREEFGLFKMDITEEIRH